MLTWLVLILLIGINAFYVTAEFAAVSVRRSSIRQRAEEGSASAERLLPIITEPAQLDRYIAACQIGITWSSLVLGAYSQATLAQDFGRFLERSTGWSPITAQSTASISVLIGITALQVVFGELVPKSAALQSPAKLAVATLHPMLWSIRLYSWFLKLLNGSGTAILKLIGFRDTGHRHIHSPEEIELLIAESSTGGALTPMERQRLHRALRLAARPARQLMIPRGRMAMLDADLPPEALFQAVTDTAYSRLPVYRGSPDNIIGILHLRDFAEAFIRRRGMPAIEPMLRKVVTIPEHVTTDKLLALMREQRSHQALVVDEFGVIGQVTMGDILGELLGEVADEFKLGRPQPQRLPDGRVRLPGSMHLDEVGTWVGVQWESEADTVGGHVTNAAGHLPAPGEKFNLDGVEVEVESVANRVIVSVLATPLPPGEEE